ncbi:MAG TPA: efflux RND transporter periplasmic adaptor subunit [Gemmataceae bacterium]|nr:efflux RND transporter periplasmic adaptor subunit [Gemmataceae bacterium]
MKSPVSVLLVVLGIASGVVLGAGAMWLSGSSAPGSARPSSEGRGERFTRTPSFGKLRPSESATSVAALGRLIPKGEVIDVGGLMGDRLGKLEVEEGKWVEQGAILGYLDSHGERQAERAAAAAQLEEARARLAAERAYADALIKTAEVGVRQPKELDPLDNQAQEAKIQLLETELATAQTDLERSRSLTSPGAIPQQKLDQQAQLVRRCRQELAAARTALAKARAGHLLSQDRAQAELQAAQAGRKRAEAAVQIESLTRNLALADIRVERTILRAPSAGYVLKILAHPGERVDSRSILKLGDTRVMYAVAEVYETDILLVRPGQRAKVTSPALTEALGGTVEKVGRIIFKNDVLSVDPAAAADARVVEVWIRLDPSDTAARLINLQVDVLIDLGDAASSPG